ncbi:MAG: four helix bundle protein [Ignavibacteriales bacterium]
MNTKTEELLKRTFKFGVDTLKFLNSIPHTAVNKVLIYQLAKSSTSIGANYEESQAAESTDDFIHKIGISSKEVRESNYWLRILKEMFTDNAHINQKNILIEESSQLKKIFTSIKLSAQEKKRNIK